MKKKLKLFLATLLASCCCASTAILAGCGEEEETPQASTYTVSFNSNGGSAVAGTTVTSDDPFITEPNDPTKDGYTFEYWALNGNEFDFDTLITDDVELNAVWTPIEYAITYQGDGAMPSTGLTYNVENRATFSLPTPTAPEGYSFVAWHQNSIDGAVVTSLAECTGAITLVAEYSLDTYTITFVGEGNLPQNFNYTVLNRGEQTILEPTRDHYEFVAWQDEEGMAVTSLNGRTGNITLTAIWQPVYWFITYQGDGTMPSTGLSYNMDTRDTFVLPTPTHPQAGFEFTGWVDTQGNPVTSLADKTGAITLVATWENRSYTVRWRYNSTTLKTETRQGTAVGQTVSATPDPTFVKDNVVYVATNGTAVTAQLADDGSTVLDLEYAIGRTCADINEMTFGLDADRELTYTPTGVHSNNLHWVFDGTDYTRNVAIQATIKASDATEVGVGLAVRDESYNTLLFLFGGWDDSVHVRLNGNNLVQSFSMPVGATVFSDFDAGKSVTVLLTVNDGVYRLYQKLADGTCVPLLEYAPSTDVTVSGQTFHVADGVQTGFVFWNNDKSMATLSKVSVDTNASNWAYLADTWEFTNASVAGIRENGFSISDATMTSTGLYKGIFLKNALSGTALTIEATFTWYGINHFNGGFAIKQGENVIYFRLQNYNQAFTLRNSQGGDGYVGTLNGSILGGHAGESGQPWVNTGSFPSGTPLTLKLEYKNGFIQIFYKDGANWLPFTQKIDVTQDPSGDGRGDINAYADWRSTPVYIVADQAVTLGFAFDADWTGNGHVDGVKLSEGASFDLPDEPVRVDWDVYNVQNFEQNATTSAVSFTAPNTDDTVAPADQKWAFYPTHGQTFTATATFEHSSGINSANGNYWTGFRGGFAVRQNGYIISFQLNLFNASMLIYDSQGNEEYIGTTAGICGKEGIFGANKTLTVRMIYRNGIVELDYINPLTNAFEQLIPDFNIANTIASKGGWDDSEWTIGDMNASENVEVGVMFGTKWSGEGKVSNLVIIPNIVVAPSETIAKSSTPIEVESFTKIKEIGYASSNGLGNTAQGAASYGKYYFQFENTHDRVLVIDLDTLNVIDTIWLTANTAWHSNTANFGTEIYSDTGFPLLYVAQENVDEHKTLVYAVRQSGNDFSLELVQTIIFPSYKETGVFYQNSYIDGKNNAFWVSGYTDTNYWSGANANKIYMMQYELPSLADGAVVTLSVQNIIKTVAWEFMYALQGGFFQDGIFYQVYGGSDAGRARGLRIVDFYATNLTYQEVSLLDYGLTNTADDNGYSDEMEAITYYDGAFYIGCVHGRMYKLVLGAVTDWSQVTWANVDLTGKILEGKKLLYNNTTPDDGIYNETVDYVDISAYEFVEVTCSLWKSGGVNHSAIILYDENKNVVATYTYAELASYGVALRNDLPANYSYSFNVDAVKLKTNGAKYIRFSNKTATGSDDNNKDGYQLVEPVLRGGNYVTE